LAEKAPENLLSKGSRFELMEGSSVVAEGLVIADAEGSEHR
jgi:hypothetical protein